MWSVFNKVAFKYDSTFDYARHKLIKMERIRKKCRFCRALKWKDGTAGMCCSGGNISILLIERPVEPLKQLFSLETAESRHFLNNIRKYNLCFHTASFGTDSVTAIPRILPICTIQGQVCHRIGSLLPTSSMQPELLQIYFMGDGESKIQRWSRLIPGVDRETVRKIQRVLHNNNA
ncbi:hypothetical protein HNY73_000943 [Argiope bruennichi]|uniref:Uncharacterized protein n=1 Tax=Argiope bruennichi TaxID=94029 RepID=A0A8T0FZR4_ARGBR|nr:hypothetical protein HNY73_000943 [Argiope bruennichi]